MYRTPVAVACTIVLAVGAAAAAVPHPQHHKAQMVAADLTGPPVTDPVPILMAPTTTTTTLPPPPTVPTTDPPRPHERTARIRAAAPTTSPQASPQPVDAVGCIGGWSAMADLPAKIARAHRCWDGLISQYAWSAPTAFSVMMCESEGDPLERNSSGATGLMQVLGGPTDPAANMATAADMYSHRGWQPWDASAYCWRSAKKG